MTGSLFLRPSIDKFRWVVYISKMDDFILKTVIFIMRDTTNKPIVVSHFQGFKDDNEALDFSEFLKEQFIQEKTYPNVTLH